MRDTPEILAPQPPPRSELPDPWSSLNEAGDGLTVNHFLTTALSQTTLMLRRTITLPYVQQFGLTVPEWRLLSLIAHAQSLPFSELVVQSTSDKSLVSRTLRLLEKRGLVEIRAQGNTPRKKLTCLITAEGSSLHAQVIPLARRAQAQMLRVMTSEERRVVFQALKLLQSVCTQSPDARLDNEGDEAS